MKEYWFRQTEDGWVYDPPKEEVVRTKVAAKASPEVVDAMKRMMSKYPRVAQDIRQRLTDGEFVHLASVFAPSTPDVPLPSDPEFRAKVARIMNGAAPPKPVADDPLADMLLPQADPTPSPMKVGASEDVLDIAAGEAAIRAAHKTRPRDQKGGRK